MLCALELHLYVDGSVSWSWTDRLTSLQDAYLCKYLYAVCFDQILDIGYMISMPNYLDRGQVICF